MINWPTDKRLILAFVMVARDENGKKVTSHLEAELQRLMKEGYKNLKKVSEYAGAIKTLEMILEIFNNSQEQWEKINERDKGRGN